VYFHAVIAILDYGSGNLRSVARAIERVGGDALVTGDAADVQRADALVIPGVGHFGSCARAIVQRSLDGAVRTFAEGGRPMFGVCVGMQVLLESSEEDGQAGLGVVRGRSRRLPTTDTVKVPHMGWNTVVWSRTHPYVTGIPSGTRFYFVHSFAPDLDADLTIGTTEHGRSFSSVLARETVFATQFHPEKSGDAGLQLYGTFVKAATT
jgi:glutamine amidotransferase